MQALHDMASKFGIASDLIKFLWQAKMWWMIPVVSVLVLLGLLIVFGSSTGVGPFIYTLF